MRKQFRKYFDYIRKKIDQNTVGNEAKLLLEKNSAFTIACEALQWRYMERIMNSGKFDVDEREHCKMKIDMIYELTQELQDLYSQSDINKMMEEMDNEPATAH